MYITVAAILFLSLTFQVAGDCEAPLVAAKIWITAVALGYTVVVHSVLDLEDVQNRFLLIARGRSLVIFFIVWGYVNTLLEIGVDYSCVFELKDNYYGFELELTSQDFVDLVNFMTAVFETQILELPWLLQLCFIFPFGGLIRAPMEYALEALVIRSGFGGLLKLKDLPPPTGKDTLNQMQAVTKKSNFATIRSGGFGIITPGKKPSAILLPKFKWLAEEIPHKTIITSKELPGYGVKPQHLPIFEKCKNIVLLPEDSASFFKMTGVQEERQYYLDKYFEEFLLTSGLDYVSISKYVAILDLFATNPDKWMEDASRLSPEVALKQLGLPEQMVWDQPWTLSELSFLLAKKKLTLSQAAVVYEKDGGVAINNTTNSYREVARAALAKQRAITLIEGLIVVEQSAAIEPGDYFASPKGKTGDLVVLEDGSSVWMEIKSMTMIYERDATYNRCVSRIKTAQWQTGENGIINLQILGLEDESELQELQQMLVAYCKDNYINRKILVTK